MKKTFYLDNDNNVVEMEQATHFIVQEFDEEGNFEGEKFGSLGQNSNFDENGLSTNEPSPEIQKVLNDFVDRHGMHPFRQ